MPQPSSDELRRFSVPPVWVWLFAVTGYALVMPPAIEAAHYTPLPSLERHPIDWSSVISWAGLVLALCFALPWFITSRRRARGPHREADFATRLGRILAMLAAASFLISVGLSDHWGWQVHLVDWIVAAGWLGLAGIRTRELIRTRR